MDAASLDPRLRGSESNPPTTTITPSAAHGQSQPPAFAAAKSPTISSGHGPPGQTYASAGSGIIPFNSTFSPTSQSHTSPPTAGATPSSTSHHHITASGSPGNHATTPQSPSTSAFDANGNPLPPGQGQGQDAKKPRACEACRGLKVRCDPDPADPEGPCRRCAKAGRKCVVTQPTRKRQKKTDSRVAELEKKIDALTASLQASRGGPATTPSGGPSGGQNIPRLGGGHGEETGGGEYGGRLSIGNGGLLRDWSSPLAAREVPPPPAARPVQQQPLSQSQSPYGMGMVMDKAYPPPMVMAGQKRKFTETRDTAAEDTREVPQSSLGADYSDIVDRGIISMERAVELFRRYTDLMSPHLPGVVFPEGTTAADVRKSKPILFLAIMAASSSEMPNVQRTIVKEMMQVFADKVIIVGEKNVELVQALHVAVIWYWPPEHFEELKFYQLVHMAAVMAIDIGLGRKKPGRNRRHIPYTWRDHPFKKHPLPDSCSIESRRTWLTCYFLASNTSMALHRPNLIRWTSFMTECMEVLESSPDAAPSDKYLCHLVWTHRLAEEVGVQFAMDDPSAVINITDQRTQYALRGFERDLEKYRDAIPNELLQPSLKLSFHVLSLYMHEIALQTENNSEDFKPPYTADSMKEIIISDASLTPAHINALSACLTAIDGIFDAFLGMDVSRIRCLPVFNFVRVAYATVVLIKMYFAASSPNSELGKVINKDNMKVEQHLEALLDKFRATAADDKSRPAAKFLVVLVMIRSWFQKQGGNPCGPGQCKNGTSQSPMPCVGVADAYPATPSLPTQNSGDRAPAESAPAPTSSSTTTQQQQPSYSTTANTPLQLLSEIATNDGSTSRATNAMSSVSWLNISQTPQPFMYDAVGAGANSGTPNTVGGPPTPNPPGTTGTDGGGANGGGGGGLNPLGIGARPMPWLNATFSSNFDYSNMGDGFAQAMDLTLAGITDGAYGLPDSMQYMMVDQPWFDNMGGGSFQFPG